LAGQLARRLGRYRLDAVDNLGRVDQAIEQQQLARHLLGPGRGASSPISRPALCCALERASSASVGFSEAARVSCCPTTSDQLVHHLRAGCGVDAEQSPSASAQQLE
jgi:hypothetical protein